MRSSLAKTQTSAIGTSNERCANPMTTLSFKREVPLILLCLVSAIGSVPAADKNAGNKALIGRWDLTIKDANGKELPSWLELSRDQELWKARFVGRWGHARFLPAVEIAGYTIYFVSPKEEEGSKTDLIFDGKLNGKTLTGIAKG